MLMKSISTTRLDVVLSHSGDGAFFSILFNNLRRRSHIAYVTLVLGSIYEHLRRPLGPLDFVTNGLEVKRAENVVTTSRMMAGHLADFYGVDQNKIHVLYPGVDHLKFTPEKKNEAMRREFGNKTIMLYVGRLVELKGIVNLVCAASRIAKEYADFVLVIVGAGPKKVEIEEMVRKLGIEENVKVLGKVSNELMPYYYASSDLTIIPSIDLDAFPSVTLESLACGTPSIVSNRAGSAELIVPGKNGYVINPKDLDQTAGTIVNCLLDQKKLRKMREYCRTYVERNWTWDIVADRYHSFLCNVVRSRRC